MIPQKQSGNNGEKVTPVPIPNTEVKLLSADGSWDFVPVRVGRCQAKDRNTLSVFFNPFLQNRKTFYCIVNTDGVMI